MGDETLHMIDHATRQGAALAEGETFAVAASCHPGAESLRIRLANGVLIDIPLRLIEGLASATAGQRAEVVVAGAGFGLHWPSLDLDLSVPHLLAGVFGTRAWVDRQRAAKAGTATTPAKADAARRNGAKGGRPRKSVA